MTDETIAALRKLRDEAETEMRKHPIASPEWHLHYHYFCRLRDALSAHDERQREAKERECFMQDDDGHWYVIKDSEREEFIAWEAAAPHWESYSGKHFDDRAIGTHPSRFSFTDLIEEL